MPEMNIRDRVLGRLSIAQHFAKEIDETIDATIAHFIESDEDPKGKERRELMEQAEYGAHMIASALGDAQAAMADMSKEDLAEGEGFGDDTEEDDADDE